MLALGVCFPQTCSSAGRRFAASRSRLHYHQRLEIIIDLPIGFPINNIISLSTVAANHVVSTKTISMKCFVNWNLLRFHVGWRNTQPHLNWFVLSLTLTRAYLLFTLQNLYTSNAITPVCRFETTNCHHNNSNDTNSQQHRYACICAAVCQCVSG